MFNYETEFSLKNRHNDVAKKRKRNETISKTSFNDHNRLTVEKGKGGQSLPFSHGGREIERNLFPSHAGCEMPYPFPFLRGHPRS